MTIDLARRATAEALGTALLVAVVVGSGIFAQRLSPNDVGLQLLENSTATAAGLVALILAFGSVSGAHFNPIVSLADRFFGGLSNRELGIYVPAQIVGGCFGAIVANLMFGLPAVTLLDARSIEQRPLARRDRRDLRPVRARDLRRGALGSPLQRALRRGRLHRGGVLVHLLDQLRQPGRHDRSHADRHVRRDQAVVGPRVRRGTAVRWRPRDRPGFVPVPGHGRTTPCSSPTTTRT